MKISVIITNWNGLALLKKYLEKVILASPEAKEIILADDASDDASVDFASNLKHQYPQLKIITHQKNHGFSRNTNDAVKKATGNLVVLLNNDIDPHPGYITKCLKHFRDSKVVGVGFSELGNENYGRLYWENGYFQIEPKYSSKTHISSWVSGGSSIIRRDFFLKLGGFDNIYEPFYFEDLDFGFRTWRSGYQLLWEPKAIVEHKHESTTSKFPKKFLIYVKERNHLLSVLRNISSPRLRLENKIFSILRILSGPNYIKIILAARRQLKKYPPQRLENRLSDIEVLRLFEK